tara:strand:- start:3858 stop:4769 length:912 start_codon:yes stop_codon:yes gene_type:complete
MKKELKELEKKFGKKIIFNETLSKYSWFNLGGPANILFKPDTEDQIINFLNLMKDNYEIICIGAGSNTLVRDGGFDGVVIKLSPKFSYIKKINNNLLEVGASTLDKRLSSYAAENEIAGFEFLSCIPGSIGGAIIMNSGCYGDEISNILSSIKAIDFKGKIIEIQKDDIKFYYRGTSLPKNLIIISANFEIKKGNKNMIHEKMNKYFHQKKESQPTRVKTCGSTFKNPKEKKAWELIKNSNCSEASFGKAKISSKHNNFFINEGGASSKDIEKLINYVKRKVFEQQNIKLDLEIQIIGKNISQ